MPSHPLLNLPIITEEEERAERAALSEKERLQIHLDVYGRPPAVNAEPGTVTNAPEQEVSLDTIRRELENQANAIAAISESEKREYLQAQKLVPELVASESPPETFLRFENLNAQTSAARLVRYWKQRVALFGNERAFLPLTLDGAMRDDLELINQALTLPLPSDNYGRPVLLWNRTGYDRSNHKIYADAVLRVFMFIAHRAGYAKQKGFIILNNMQGLALNSQRYDRSVPKRFQTLMAALPFTVFSVHICTGPGKSVGELILPVLKKVYGRHLRLRTIFHSGSFREVLYELEKFGMSESQVAPLYRGSADRQALMQEWLVEEKAGRNDDA